MNNKSSGIGCALFVVLAIVISIFQFLFTTTAGWLIIGSVGFMIFMIVKTNRETKQAKFVAAMENAAQTMDDIASGKEITFDGGFSLSKGEKVIYAMPVVALTEYQSTGSSYSGASGGVSFPLAGSLRGNVGMQGGQITKNPDQLMVVDQGRAIFTDQRIVFTGAKLVRDFDLDKIVDLTPGPNGINVRIAVSNRERTSGLQALDLEMFGPGYVAGYVFTLHDQGPAKAKAWAKDVSTRLRAIVSEQRDKVKAKGIEAK